MGRYEVSLRGLRRQVAGWPPSFVLRELWQNACDTAARRIEITLRPVPGRPLVELVVEDDDPQGFQSFDHAWTLYAESAKVADPTKAGRFNLGEKYVIALATEASIATTTGTVEFSGDERHEYPRRKRRAGSVFRGLFPFTRDQLEEIERSAKALIVPEGVEATLNGVALERRQPVASFTATLTTVVADEAGVLRSRERSTTVGVYEPMGEPSLYELGIPVCPVDVPWDCDIRQKVPLGAERDNVPARYMQSVRVAVLNAMHDRLSEEQIEEKWVDLGSDDPRVSREAMADLITRRHGDDAVGSDPTDREAERRSVAQGRQVVHGGSYSKQQWAKIHEYGLLPRAGEVNPSPRPFSDDPEAPPAEQVPRSEWTPGMLRLERYLGRIAPELIGRAVTMDVLRRFNASACYCRATGTVTFNLQRLGRAWFDRPLSDPGVNELLIHELAHQFGSHLEEGYDDALARLGARLAALALAHPEVWADEGSKAS